MAAIDDTVPPKAIFPEIVKFPFTTTSELDTTTASALTDSTEIR
jgi:hypothetical protein